MDLYKIMLVDDEAEVRESIIKNIPWTQLGFTVVGDAENGQDAFEKLEILDPDVVLTDIKMPYMDGLTLAEKMRQYYPSVKIIIFSGFDEFEYAKQAIKLNVIEYIVKPINVEELTAILKRLKESLDQEMENRRDIDRLREDYQRSIPMIREHFLNDLLHGRLSTARIEEGIQRYNIDVTNVDSWAVARVHIHDMARGEAAEQLKFKQEPELLPIVVRQLAEEKLTPYCRFVNLGVPRELIMLMAVSEENNFSSMMAALGDMVKIGKRILGLVLTVGISQTYHNLTELAQASKEAKDALGYRSVVGTGGVIYIKDIEPVQRETLRFTSAEEEELTAAIKLGSGERQQAVIDKVVGRMEAKVHHRQYQAYIISIMNAITGMIYQYELDSKTLLGESADYFEILSELNSPEDVRSWLRDICEKISEQISEERENTAQNMIRQAKTYIQNNYQNPELSVEVLCKHIHVSAAYFSTLFKKETGESYITYLTNLRMQKAVELLETTDAKTYVIAAKVGYTEPNYFSYVFKKQFGIAPSKFRGKQNV